jgi:hypothetical protein
MSRPLHKNFVFFILSAFILFQTEARGNLKFIIGITMGCMGILQMLYRAKTSGRKCPSI